MWLHKLHYEGALQIRKLTTLQECREKLAKGHLIQLKDPEDKLNCLLPYEQPQNIIILEMFMILVYHIAELTDLKSHLFPFLFLTINNISIIIFILYIGSFRITILL